MKDHEVLATLSGLRLQLIRLEYTDDDEDEIGNLLRSACSDCRLSRTAHGTCLVPRP